MYAATKEVQLHLFFCLFEEGPRAISINSTFAGANLNGLKF